MTTNYDAWVEAKTRKFHDTLNIEGFIADYSISCRRCPVLDDCLVGINNSKNISCEDTLKDYAYKLIRR